MHYQSVFTLYLKVSIKITKHTDEAVWIRIAWGDPFSRPNHLKPTYVVHYLQTPYVFLSSLTSKQKPLLSQVRMTSVVNTSHCLSSFLVCFHPTLRDLFALQALILSTRYQAIKDANLSGRKLTAIRDLLMKQYLQVCLIYLFF